MNTTENKEGWKDRERALFLENFEVATDQGGLFDYMIERIESAGYAHSEALIKRLEELSFEDDYNIKVINLADAIAEVRKTL